MVEEEAVAGIGDFGDPGLVGGEARQEAADRHVGVDDIGFFGAQDGVAAALGATPMQVALAWLLRRAPHPDVLERA